MVNSWGPLGAPLGKSWGPLGAFWGGLWALLGRLFGPKANKRGTRLFRPPPLGSRNIASWSPLGALLGASWALLGPFWALFGSSWGSLGQSWSHLEASEAFRKPNGEKAKNMEKQVLCLMKIFGLSVAVLGGPEATWSSLRAALGPLGAANMAPRGPKKAQDGSK